MKRAATLWTLDIGHWTLGSGLLLCLLAVLNPAFALTSDNPYNGIVERNAFAIKPPPPPPVITAPAPPPAGVELRGITTLLGRPQVLLNFKLPAKPPEPAKDRSLVMDIGQREGDIEVLEINPAAGTVRIRNQGNELPMSLKDNAAKPQAAPGLAAPVFQPPPGMTSGLPAPGGIPAPAAGTTTVTPFGGSANPSVTRPGMPTRNLRSGNTSGAGADAAGNSTLSREAQMALIEIERERTKDAVSAGKMPPLPPINLDK
jgi:hypothetical protein